jgi:hypothetical protein
MIPELSWHASLIFLVDNPSAIVYDFTKYCCVKLFRENNIRKDKNVK